MKLTEKEILVLFDNSKYDLQKKLSFLSKDLSKLLLDKRLRAKFLFMTAFGEVIKSIPYDKQCEIAIMIHGSFKYGLLSFNELMEEAKLFFPTENADISNLLFIVMFIIRCFSFYYNLKTLDKESFNKELTAEKLLKQHHNNESK